MKIPPDKNDLQQRMGLFRHSVIAPLLHKPQDKTMAQMLAERAALTYDIPGTHRTQVAEETIRGWLRMYKHGGFDALLPKVRNDLGSARAIPAEVADLLCELKENNRSLSVPLLLKAAKESGRLADGIVLAESTVHRLLKSKGLAQKVATDPTSKDRRKFEYELAGELWTSDVMCISHNLI